jgi:ABC-2 type transport system ATP-binding protein
MTKKKDRPGISALKIDKLEKTYEDNVEALQGVSLDIPEGSFYGLLGPNGAGKSTLIHSVTGLVVPTGGRALVFGEDSVKDYKEARTFVGFSPQEINLDWFLTVEQTLDYHGRYFGMDKAYRKERSERLMRAFSLLDKRNAKTNFLSGGMKRRVIIARALMHEPKLLILDEPTAGVDVELRHELWDYMRRINKAGTTILLTTHYIEEAEKLCDRISLINEGKIIKTGTVTELKKAYKKKTLEEVYLAATGKKKLPEEDQL